MKHVILNFFTLFTLSFGELATLKQVHVIFRHGDRTPDTFSYPTDPYINETYYPTGKGQLTMLGKQQEYKIGLNLRKAYGRFLGNIYTENILEARSTGIERTKMSLQLVLAGLWPPALSQKWNQFLNWQPIPYVYESIYTDKILRNVFVDDNLKDMYNKILQLDDVKLELEGFQWMFKIISENAGINTTCPADIISIYFALYIQNEMGFILPSWTESVFPYALEQAVVLDYKLKNYNSEIQKVSIGGLFGKIKTDIMNKMSGTSGTKLYLYSAHEFIVAFTLIGLNIYNDHVPSYGSYVTLELHKINGHYGIKLFYNDYLSDIPVPIIMPECELFCEVDKFFNLIKHITG